MDRHHPNLNNIVEMVQFLNDHFLRWFQKRIKDDEQLNNNFIDLIRGPISNIESYKGCKVNGIDSVAQIK